LIDVVSRSCVTSVHAMDLNVVRGCDIKRRLVPILIGGERDPRSRRSRTAANRAEPGVYEDEGTAIGCVVGDLD